MSREASPHARAKRESGLGTPPNTHARAKREIGLGLLCLWLYACGSSGSGPGASTGTAGQAPDASTVDASGPAFEGGGVGAPSEGGPTDALLEAEAAALDASVAAGDGAGAEDAPSTGSDVASPGDVLMPVYVTFYGWEDNSPPGAAIAYPKSGGYATHHDMAGGTGTYADPITFATDMAEFAVGTVLYIPFIEKYAVMEDDCVECDSDWTGSRKFHIDVWMNSNGSEDPAALNRCEDQWTRSSTNVEVSPPPTRPVTTPPLFEPTTNVCRSSP